MEERTSRRPAAACDTRRARTIAAKTCIQGEGRNHDRQEPGDQAKTSLPVMDDRPPGSGAEHTTRTVDSHRASATGACTSSQRAVGVSESGEDRLCFPTERGDTCERVEEPDVVGDVARVADERGPAAAPG